MKENISAFKFKRKVFHMLSAQGVEVADNQNVLDICVKLAEIYRSEECELSPMSVVKDIVETYNC